ncbi:hypothetical protein ACFV23_13875 [Streptomyces sp. NPDC059627]
MNRSSHPRLTATVAKAQDTPTGITNQPLVIYSARHQGDGTWDDTLCYFRRRTEPADGAQHTHFVEMYFTPEGHALPGYEPADQPADARIQPRFSRLSHVS